MSTPAITTYAKDLTGWQRWQVSYRYGALYMFPPPDIRASINALRAQYDPQSQAFCDAHISLTAPFSGPVTPSNWAALQARLQRACFDVTYGPVHRWPGGVGVVLLVEPADMIRQMIDTLEGADGLQFAPPRRPDFTPHMTIAEFVSADESAALFEVLSATVSGGRFRCTRLSYAVPDEDFHFTERAWLHLTDGSTG